jgi:hypothetical protein
VVQKIFYICLLGSWLAERLRHEDHVVLADQLRPHKVIARGQRILLLIE